VSTHVYLCEVLNAVHILRVSQFFQPRGVTGKVFIAAIVAISPNLSTNKPVLSRLVKPRETRTRFRSYGLLFDHSTYLIESSNMSMPLEIPIRQFANVIVSKPLTVIPSFVTVLRRYQHGKRRQ
jgi:hypothetical protein